ncbi:hypothetical protein [Alkalihalobacillus sp. BA299]|uniref:hypothetical protein n=1 Tax=Alkalihalobacillus sp. BA299 TaxID=2815938 RepID=UPI001ADB392A|nr:hypothetical protein [Alkalihalobacillus sp. BA299]
MKKVKVFIMTGLLIGAFSSTAFAEHNPEADKTINISTGAKLNDIPAKSADTTEDVTKVIGENMDKLSRDYSYIYIQVDDQYIAIIDPPAVGY